MTTPPRTIPANPQPGEKYAEYAGDGGFNWFVYDPAAGDDEWTAAVTTEDEARLLVFGAKSVGFLRMLANHPEVELSMFAGDLLELLEVPR